MRNMVWELFDVHGRRWRLNHPDSPVRLVKGGLPELYAQQVATVAAGRVVKGKSRVMPGSGSMTVGFYPKPGVDLGQVRRDFRAGWANDAYCVLCARHEDGVVVEANVRLPDDSGLPVREVLTPHIFDTVTVPLGWDDGVWWLRSRQPGPTVEIQNTGVAPVRVRVEWQRGGRVVLPSGAGFTLPTVKEPRVVALDRAAGFPVTTLAGEPDRTLTRQLWGAVIEEKIMPNTTGTLTVPTGGHVIWEIGVAEP